MNETLPIMPDCDPIQCNFGCCIGNRCGTTYLECNPSIVIIIASLCVFVAFFGIIIVILIIKRKKAEPKIAQIPSKGPEPSADVTELDIKLNSTIDALKMHTELPWTHSISFESANSTWHQEGTRNLSSLLNRELSLSQDGKGSEANPECLSRFDNLEYNIHTLQSEQYRPVTPSSPSQCEVSLDVPNFERGISDNQKDVLEKIDEEELDMNPGQAHIVLPSDTKERKEPRLNPPNFEEIDKIDLLLGIEHYNNS